MGGGFGGLFAAKFLRRAKVDVTLIKRNNHHLFQPLLYQVTTGVLSAGEVAPPLREVLKRHRNVTVEMGDVTGFDLAARTVQVDRPRSRADVAYDYLILGIGVGGSYFGHDEFAPFAPGMKTLEDALALRTKIFGAFEMAELAEDDAERDAWLTFAVVGWRAHGCRGRWSDHRAGASIPGPQLPTLPPQIGTGDALRGW